MNETLDEAKKVVDKMTRQAGILTERNRIMSEIYEADLPAGVWTLIRDIVNPPKKITSKNEV